MPRQPGISRSARAPETRYNRGVLKFLPWQKKTPRVALALGAGGARGLAHIPALEALDELGIKPVAIAGASMGAVIGASYASGMSGKDIRDFALDTLRGRGGIARRLVSHQFSRMRAHLRETRSLRGTPMRFDAAAVALDFLPPNLPKTFEELRIRSPWSRPTSGGAKACSIAPGHCCLRLPARWQSPDYYGRSCSTDAC